jgi:hypothetical protein
VFREKISGATADRPQLRPLRSRHVAACSSNQRRLVGSEAIAAQGRIGMAVRCVVGLELTAKSAAPRPSCDPAWKSDPLRLGVGVQYWL